MIILKWVAYLSIVIIFGLTVMLNLSFATDAENSKFIIIQDISLKNKLLYLKNGDIWVTDPTAKSYQQLTMLNDVSNFTISYDLAKIVLVRNYKKLYIIDLITSKEEFLSDLETDMSSPSISPSNDKIVYISKSRKEFDISPFMKDKVRHIWIIDVATKKSSDLTENSSIQYSTPKWSPDGGKISFTSMSMRSKGWKVYAVKADNNIEKNKKEVAEGFYSDWLDNKTLIIGSSDKITFYNVNTLKKIKEFKLETGFFPAKFSFAPPNNIYYEDGRENPNLDIGIINIIDFEQKIIFQDARSPVFGR